jgi:hypothetical protein
MLMLLGPQFSKLWSQTKNSAEGAEVRFRSDLPQPSGTNFLPTWNANAYIRSEYESGNDSPDLEMSERLLWVEGRKLTRGAGVATGPPKLPESNLVVACAVTRVRFGTLRKACPGNPWSSVAIENRANQNRRSKACAGHVDPRFNLCVTLGRERNRIGCGNNAAARAAAN